MFRVSRDIKITTKYEFATQIAHVIVKISVTLLVTTVKNKAS